MLRDISRQFRTAALVFVVLSLLTGIVYPLLVSVIAEVVFPYRASGSLIRQGEQVVGSEWIGQPFDDERYFWSRPSATGPFPYNAAASSGSNLGPLNPELTGAVRQRIDRLRAANPTQTGDVPIDLVTASGSGLDPHISPAAAEYQVARLARARKMSEDAVRQIVHAHIEGRQLGILGEPRVNVLRLNLALDRSAESE